MDKVMFVGIGGFLGACARYLLTQWTDSMLQARMGSFPFGTLTVNALGSFGLAFFGVWIAARAGLSPQLRLLVGAGFFGAFTTFSTFANDSINLLQRQGLWSMLLNVILNNGLCLLFVALGLILGQRWLGNP